MKTETITTIYEIYKFNELSEDAKENVRQWYLNGQEAYIFTEMCKEDLYNLFGKNNLDVQYSLSSCQGDGFNIYGKISAWKILECLEKHNGGSQLEEFENVLTKEEKEVILKYGKECEEIKLPYNNHYCYSLSEYIDIKNEWEYDLEYADYTLEDIDVELLEKFENLVREIFYKLCKGFEKLGYEYFYEVYDGDLEEFCECNDFEFLEDGTVFTY